MMQESDQERYMRGGEGAGYLFSEPHLRFSEIIETTTEADLA